MAELAGLKYQRKTIKCALTRMINFCNNENVNVQIEDVRVRVERAEELIKKYEEIQNKIDDLVADNEQMLNVEEQYRSEIEEVYFNIKSIYYRLQGMQNIPTMQQPEMQNNSELTTAVNALIQHQASMSTLMERFTNNVRIENTSTPSENVQQQQQCELKLPRIQLPEFDGSLLEWVRFKELFEALIHNKSNISNVEKLEYLHSKLKGEALLVIKHLKPMNSNYVVAWELLNKKYNNVEKIKNTYMELLFEQEAMKSSSLAEAKRIYNSINEGFNALKALDSSVDQWSSVLLYNIEKKLDHTTAILWFREKQQNQVATFTQFLAFMEKRVAELESIQYSSQHTTVNKQHQKQKFTRTYSSSMQTCPICTQHHFLYQCDEFKKMNVHQRRQIVQKHNVCFNCLRDNHRVRECKSSSCKKCDKKHNTLLHITNGPETSVNSQVLTNNNHEANSQVICDQTTTTICNDTTADNQTSTMVSSNALQNKNHSCVLLPTAIVEVLDNSGTKQKCRALLDSGSQGTLVTEACVQRLGLKRQFNKTIIYGLGSSNGRHTRGSVQLQISVNTENKLITTQALCLINLTQILPSQYIENDKFNYFHHLQMADPYFNKPTKIDIILGADVFLQCCLPQKLVHPTGTPIALNTVFGWVLMGQIQSPSNNAVYSNHLSIELDQILKQFWETENIPEKSLQLKPEDKEAEDYFVKTTQRLSNGRYMVRLPFKNGIIDIGQSKHNAMKRLFAMENKYKQDSVMEADYKTFMREYIDLGHMEQIDETTNTQDMCFLPHHAIIKPSSTTSKLRVVFDASSKTSNGQSLNDNLLVGPKIQRELFDMLINFRIYAIAIIGDIEKMYRQIIMNKDDRLMQCVLWRNSESENVKTYTLNTITYGTAAAPFLAIRTLHQIADDNAQQYPNAANAIRKNFYVDDFMYSTENEQQAIKIKTELSTVLSEAGFHIRKWSSNSSEFLNTIPIDDKAASLDTKIQYTSTVSTLGLLWDTKADHFKYSISLASTSRTITKRTVLSDIAKLFDPLGWIAPVIVHMKIFMQKLWLSGIGWDEDLPPELRNQWTSFRNSLNEISNINISRWIKYTNEATIELHGFSDASERAYAATVYIKVLQRNGDISTHLIAAKTRVTPIKQISLPRLELCAAHLVTKLLIKVQNSLEKGDIPMYGWTDSTVVLAWIADHPCRWKTFIANRTTQIIDAIPARQWYHIKSHQYPADIATRGIYADKLIGNKLWWYGPDALRMKKPPTFNPENIPNTCHIEERQKVYINTAILEQSSIINLYSNFTKLLRITALLKRFINNCKIKTNKIAGFITVAELHDAHTTLVKISQNISFREEINILSSGRQLPLKHNLTSITPFLDDNGIMRVGGRINNASVNYDQRHPIILNGKHELTKLIIRQYHIQNCHAGKRLLFYLIHLKYWITSSTQIIKEIIYKCSVCMRQRGKPYQQLMGDLPRHRVVPTPVFTNVGIDFAGPVQVLAWKGRGNKIHKCWISIFVCLVTKAIHIELVTELSTTAFIAALRRFISRRGKPNNIYTDNGTNFIGAHHYLTDLYNFLKNNNSQDTINTYLTSQEIKWHFSPPSGPHFGGIWEAGVKSIKYHMKRVLKDAHPTFEEMNTILCQIEMCLNSRPLCIKFEGDVDPLTPAHFILLRPMTTIPDADNHGIKENYLSRWQYAQRLVQQFWRKWSIEYLHQMQQRPKWKKKLEDISENDIVVIKEDNLAPSNWIMGKITHLHRGNDGLARVATVKTATGELKRPVSKLCPLFINT